jgi:putative ABC transport system permease protein
MIRATIKGLLSRKVRLVLSGLSVVLGVMFVSGAFVLTDTLGRSFEQLFSNVFANTDVRVSPVSKVASGTEDGTVTINTATVDRLRDMKGVVSQADGIVLVDGARLIGANGKTVGSYGPPRFGVDWPSRAGVVVMRDGQAPTADDQIAINAGLAKAGGVKVGDRVGVLTPQSPTKQTFTIAGVYGFAGGRDSQGGSQEIAFTQPMAQRLMLGATGLFSNVDLKSAPGMSDDAVRDRVAAELGSAYQVQTGKQLADANTAQLTSALKFFNNILIGFAAVALFVSVFLILNTFSIIVAQRTRELALMRAMGASRRQVIGSVLLEAGVTGLVAAVLGLAAGVGIGALLAKLFSSLGGGGLELAPLGIPVAAWVGAFVVGVGVTVVAALIPALRASRIPPVAAMREASTQDRPLTRITVFGAAVFALGATALGLGLTDRAGGNDLWAILGGVLFAFIGTALLTPLVARPVSAAIGRLFAWSVPGSLGRLNAGRNPRRTAITAAALMVGIALITGVNTVLTSAKASITKIADDQAHVDLIISGDPGGGGPGVPPSYDRSVIDKAAAMHGVKSATALYESDALLNGGHEYVGAFTDESVVPGMFSLTPAAGSIASVADGQAIVDADSAQKQGLTVGSPLDIQLPRGEPLHLTLTGIYNKSDLISGFMLPISAVQNFRSVQPDMGFIQVDPGASVATIKSQVDSLLADSPEVSVTDRNGYLAQQSASADQVLTMVQILLALAILIAVLGVINTLALSVLERTRELGLLRAIGLSRAQTMRMITVEAVVISAFGALLGLVVGTGLGAAVVRALKNDGITELALPWTQLVTYLVLAGLVGVVAAALPAIRAARTNVLQAIAYE